LKNLKVDDESKRMRKWICKPDREASWRFERADLDDLPSEMAE
jgi:hypothetical protein